MKGAFSWLFCWLVVPVHEFFFYLGFSRWPSKKYFVLAVHYLNSFVTIAQQAGQAAVLGRLSLSVRLWSEA
jgi:hypothetical protein